MFDRRSRVNFAVFNGSLTVLITTSIIIIRSLLAQDWLLTFVPAPFALLAAIVAHRFWTKAIGPSDQRISLDQAVLMMMPIDYGSRYNPGELPSFILQYYWGESESTQKWKELDQKGRQPKEYQDMAFEAFDLLINAASRGDLIIEGVRLNSGHIPTDTRLSPCIFVGGRIQYGMDNSIHLYPRGIDSAMTYTPVALFTEQVEALRKFHGVTNKFAATINDAERKREEIQRHLDESENTLEKMRVPPDEE